MVSQCDVGVQGRGKVGQAGGGDRLILPWVIYCQMRTYWIFSIGCSLIAGPYLVLLFTAWGGEGSLLLYLFYYNNNKMVPCLHLITSPGGKDVFLVTWFTYKPWKCNWTT